MNIVFKLFKCTNASAAVEAAIFTPIFLLFMLGITDLGSKAYIQMQFDAATQAGVLYIAQNSTYIVQNGISSSLSSVQTAMNRASGSPSFCTTYATCSICNSTTPSCPVTNNCKDTYCYEVIAITPISSPVYQPFLPDTAFSWSKPQTITSTATIRIQ